MNPGGTEWAMVDPSAIISHLPPTVHSFGVYPETFAVWFTSDNNPALPSSMSAIISLNEVLSKLGELRVFKRIQQPPGIVVVFSAYADAEKLRQRHSCMQIGGTRWSAHGIDRATYQQYTRL